MSTDIDTSDTIDPTPYIRTYAKDFAALSGKRQAEPVSTKRSEIESHYKPRSMGATEIHTSPAQKNSPIDLSELEREAENIDATTLQEITPPSDESAITEPLSLPKIVPGDIQRAPTPPQPRVVEPQPLDFPAGPVQTFNPILPTPSVSQTDAPTREGILARLRSHTSKQPTAAEDRDTIDPVVRPDTQLHGKFVLPEFDHPTDKVPAPMPTFHSQEAPIRPIQAPAKEIPVLQSQTPAPSPFHSFTSDFADRIDQKQASTFSVLAAEKDAPRVPVARAGKNSQFLAVLLGLVLIFASVGGGYAAYRYMNSNAPVAVLPSSVPSLIAVDNKIELTGSGIQLQEALAKAATDPVPTDSVTITYITAPGSVPGTNVPQAGGALFNALKLPAPDILTRNIEPLSTVGIVHAGSETRPFFILKVSSYQRTFAGMLSWESTIPSNLAIFYPLYPAVQPVTSSTTIASQPIQAVSTGTFVDEVVANHDARVLKDTAGNTLIIYGYADQMTLVIARDEAAFTLLLGRLQNAAH